MDLMDSVVNGVEDNSCVEQMDDLTLFLEEHELKQIPDSYVSCVDQLSTVGKPVQDNASRSSAEAIGNLTFMSKSVYTLVSNIFKCPISEETLKNNLATSAPKIPFLSLRQCDPWLQNLADGITPDALDSEVFTSRFIPPFLRAAFPLINLLDGLSKGRLTHSRVETAVTDSLLLLSSAVETIHQWRRENLAQKYNLNHLKCPTVSPSERELLFPTSFEQLVLSRSLFDDDRTDADSLPDLELNSVSKFGAELVAGNSSLPTIIKTIEKYTENDRCKTESSKKDNASQTNPVTVLEGKGSDKTGSSRNTTGAANSSNSTISYDTSSGSSNGRVGCAAGSTSQTDSRSSANIESSKTTNDSKISKSGTSPIVTDAALDPLSARKQAASNSARVAGEKMQVESRSASNSQNPGAIEKEIVEVVRIEDTEETQELPSSLSSSITIEDGPDVSEDAVATDKPCQSPDVQVVNDPKDEDIQVVPQPPKKPKFTPITGPESATATRNASQSTNLPSNTNKKNPVRVPPPVVKNPVTTQASVADINRATRSNNLINSPLNAPLRTQQAGFLPGLVAPSQAQIQLLRTQQQRVVAQQGVGVPFSAATQVLAGQRVIRAVDPSQLQTVAGTLKRPRYETPTTQQQQQQYLMNQSWGQQRQATQVQQLQRNFQQQQQNNRRTMRR